MNSKIRGNKLEEQKKFEKDLEEFKKTGKIETEHYGAEIGRAYNKKEGNYSGPLMKRSVVWTKPEYESDKTVYYYSDNGSYFKNPESALKHMYKLEKINSKKKK